MAKNMARIANGAVINIEWCSDDEQQTATLVDYNDIQVGSGDTYDGLYFYHAGERILTTSEQLAIAKATIIELDEAIIDLEYQNILLELGVNG